MRILIPTDAFPPVCGGSGWSTYELARGLRARGHDVDHRPAASRARPPACAKPTTTASACVEFGAPAPNIPYVRNYYKSETADPSLATTWPTLLAAGPLRRRPRAARDDDGRGDRRGEGRAASRSSPRCATTGRSATGRICCTRASGLDAVPGVHGRQHARLHPAARRRALAAGAADDSLHARQPRGEAQRARARRRRDRRQHAHRRRSARARAGARRRRASRSSRTRSTSRALRATRRDGRGASQARSPYALYLGKLAPNKGTSYLVDVVAPRRSRLAAGRRRRRPGSRRARARGDARRAAGSSSRAGSTRTTPRGCSAARRC